MNQKKILFIDRDGTLIDEPADNQVDSLEKLQLKPDVIVSLLRLKQRGYELVMVTNQDGLGTPQFPQSDFDIAHNSLLQIFSSQGIEFDSIRICPHFAADQCDCRKPKVGLVLDYLSEQVIDRENSYVIGDRQTDVELANAMGINAIFMGNAETSDWTDIADKILNKDRIAVIRRKTNETEIQISVNLDTPNNIQVESGIGFFNHMLEQLAKHGNFSLVLNVKGDVSVDDHHTVEDTAIVLGEALRKALGDKWGIGRYGFLLPMDESLTQVAIDLSGRSYCVFNGTFSRESVNDMSTELVAHFFRSLSEGLKATIHIDVKGENSHHMIESVFKSVGRALQQAFAKGEGGVPSTKGVL